MRVAQLLWSFGCLAHLAAVHESIGIDSASFTSDCSAYDSQMQQCLECHIIESNAKEFYSNFKQNVPEHICQTHIGSYPKELVFDANSSVSYAAVFLDTIYTTIQYTTKVLFEVRYNCDSREKCNEVLYFSVNLKDLKPIHRAALKNFVILLPLPGLRRTKYKLIMIQSHSKDACGRNFSFFNFSTDDIKAKYVSSEPSLECPDRKKIVFSPANVPNTVSSLNITVSNPIASGARSQSNSAPLSERIFSNISATSRSGDEREEWFGIKPIVAIISGICLVFAILLTVAILIAWYSKHAPTIADPHPGPLGNPNCERDAEPGSRVHTLRGGQIAPRCISERNVDNPYMEMEDFGATGSFSSNDSTRSSAGLESTYDTNFDDQLGVIPNQEPGSMHMPVDTQQQYVDNSLQQPSGSSGHRGPDGVVTFALPPHPLEAIFQIADIPQADPTGGIPQRGPPNGAIALDRSRENIPDGDDMSVDGPYGEPLDEHENSTNA